VQQAATSTATKAAQNIYLALSPSLSISLSLCHESSLNLGSFKESARVWTGKERDKERAQSLCESLV